MRAWCALAGASFVVLTGCGSEVALTAAGGTCARPGSCGGAGGGPSHTSSPSTTASGTGGAGGVETTSTGAGAGGAGPAECGPPWGQALISTNRVTLDHVAVDATGNVFTAGTFQDTVVIGGQTLVQEGGLENALVAKLDCRGDALWARRFAPSAWGESMTVAGLALDPAGAVVLAGYFSGTIDFGDGPLTSTESMSAFVARLDAGTGDCLWSRSFDGVNGAPSLAVDPGGDAYLAGMLLGTTDFGCGSIDAAKADRVFAAKLDPAGACVWSRDFGEGFVFTALAVGPSGELVLCGAGGSLSLDLGGGPLPEGSAFFVAKLDASGHHVWSRGYPPGGPSSCVAVAIDAHGTIALGGQYTSGGPDFGEEPLPGAFSGFVAELTSDGAHLHTLPLCNTISVGPSALAFDPAGNLAIAGGFTASMELDGQTFSSAAAYGFVATMTPDWALLHFESFGGPLTQGYLTDARVNGLAFDASGAPVVAGQYAGVIDFGQGPLLSPYWPAGFLARRAP